MARDLSETNISNMPDGELKAKIIRILTGCGKRVEDFREALTTEIKKQSEMKNIIMKIQNRLD